MKLTTISEEQLSTNHKLNFICGNAVCENHISEDINKLFIQAAVQSCVLSEMSIEQIKQGLRSILGGSQQATGDEKTLATILNFISPDVHVNQINKLKEKAKTSKTSVLEDDIWIDALFKTFGVNDNRIKQHVLRSVGGSLLDLGQPEEVQPDDQSQTREQVSNLRDTISKHIETSQKIAQFNQDLKKEITARQKELIARLKELQKQQKGTKSESKESWIAGILLESPFVRQNLPTILRSMVGREATINEAGLLSRAKQMIGNRSREQQNQQIADTLIKELTKITIQRFNEAARSVGLQPEQFQRVLRQYHETTRAISTGRGTPEQIEFNKKAKAKLAELFEKFNPNSDNPFKEEGVIDAEVVEDKPEDNPEKLIEFLLKTKWQTPKGTKERLSNKAAEFFRSKKLGSQEILRLLKNNKMISDKQMLNLMRMFKVEPEAPPKT